MVVGVAVFDSEVFTFILLPLLIFFARVCDVTMGTMRIIFVSRGQKYLAPLIGFIEILIWLVAIGKVMQNLDNVFCYVAYAGGFAAGNFIGICIEQKLAMGKLVVQVITGRDASELIEGLKSGGYGVTAVPAQGSTGLVHIVYSVINRSDLDDVVGIIREFNPKAFYSVEDVKFVTKGIFPLKRPLWKDNGFGLFKRWRKGK